ncbi:MAG: putative glycoside hydrolase [Candidatus Margulisiibacteriota bacterium]
MLNKILKIMGIIVLFPVFFFVLSFGVNEQGEEVVAKQKRMADRGLYITYYMSRTPSHFNYIKEQAQKSGLNTIVVDAKHILGQPLVKLAKEKKLNFMTRVTPDPWLSRLTQELHKEGFIVSARLVVFKDDHLVIARPDLAIRIKGGELYRDHKQGRWADPYSDEVRLYNELVAERAALSGVDEVQFDYIRFPAEGKAYLAYYPHEKEGVSKVDIITSFLKDTRNRISKYNVSIAVDIFGVTAWQERRADIENLGQDVKRMAKYIDVLSPMFYPSHFHSGYDGFANPGSHPYHFISTGVKKTIAVLSGEAVTIVPWIQGFNLRSPNFGPNYIQEQIKACQDLGVERYLVWNAANNYGTTFAALKEGKVTVKDQENKVNRSPDLDL